MTDNMPYITWGGSGEVLHFAHPNAYPPACFRQFLAPFTAHYRVLAMEQRPLWPHVHPASLPDWRALADDLITFFDQQGLRQVIGLGHSLGAVITAVAAAKRPDLFRQLVLVDPVFMLPSMLAAIAQLPGGVEELPLLAAARNRRYQWPDLQTAFAHYRQKPVFARFSDESLWDYVNNSFVLSEDNLFTLRFSREWEEHLYRQMMGNGGLVWDYLPRVTQPTLAVRAMETDTLHPEAWARWQQIQPEATFVEVADVGHMLMLERPLSVANLILSHLK
ncbi:MAG: alpha/beta hydrolase [Anaerolineae bacterium]|nr:alpha/beta hydrolase [Anaerolineae bacterium]